VYSLNTPTPIQCVDFNTHAFMYDRRTGETHYLSLLPAEILLLLENQSRSAHDIATIVAEACEHPMTEEWQTSIDKALDGLSQLDLIQQQ